MITDVIDIDTIGDYSSDEDESCDEREEEVYSSYVEKRRRVEEREKRRRKKKKEYKRENKLAEETEKIWKDLEELKRLLTQKQKESTFSPMNCGLDQTLPAVEAYAVGNRITPPVLYRQVGNWQTGLGNSRNVYGDEQVNGTWSGGQQGVPRPWIGNPNTMQEQPW
ncbi:hypothetical protein L873DRAFT_1920877 [Choiromyces venosus 120613-1]|uniref:Uncharacterized protein n=1 Tax=Choiromyces venosus 120613-1 TaxID=1336337 RepID=A0A3N4JJM8_9PEZI|nr:hypothetical protein L873DRAFT_1920877 [Choiromyces venosus 120613-1]